MTTILLLGKNGQVGWELQRALQPLGHVIALDRQVNKQGLCGDICNFDSLQQVMETIQPNMIVNATAYTAVDRAESDIEQADRVNHLAVKHLAELCKQSNALLIHYSTDYVFSGQGIQPWSEHDHCDPQNVYGQTKRKGEQAFEQSGIDFINFRTSWVYASRGHNFIKTMLNLAHSKSEISVISDQIGAPTGAALIADVTAQVLRYYLLKPKHERHTLIGHYHLAALGETSWYDYANFMFDQARKKGKVLTLERVNPMITKQYPTPAKRPLNSRLNTTKLQHTFDIHLPHWQVGVEQVLEEILYNETNDSA
ncbi:dTDP-4-dehydrorhamnose reductase [Acinetobacter lanii]|uniref:dTDP-4-dehydrorhamnose reductase n=1 Tax=Acinetobacter lanii TaxID=2715163 RepID=A0A6G8S7X6_9GAMM|nr:dTDP-4-dehydrorhamnose reductase [Acinetobacter lanii]QIO10191.1 dTDP-4-dehydrorhamnose reductase [Acinetobacter lanii]